MIQTALLAELRLLQRLMTTGFLRNQLVQLPLTSACLGDAFDLLRIKEQLRFFYALNDVIAFVFFDDFGIAKGLLHFLLSTRRPLFLLDHDR